MASLPEIFLQKGRPLLLTDSPAPDSLYGVSKLFGENLGWYYACFLKSFRFIGVRIGWLATGGSEDVPVDKIMRTADVERHYRGLYWSHCDCVQLFSKALDVDVEYALGYGVSDNPAPIFDLEETKRCFGYRPADNSTDFFRRFGSRSLR